LRLLDLIRIEEDRDESGGVIGGKVEGKQKRIETTAQPVVGVGLVFRRWLAALQPSDWMAADLKKWW
jgi:hypothetical protein